ncbi:unnamed protein product [Lymnaea stagnalis]|uniref:Uncharacterized protein n=1 Tax=Lymnaea stagnalis TaxID=6523 RepID=A0AAV2HGS2_LYMST
MDLVVLAAYFDLGMKEENPVKKLKVYSKKNPTEAKVFTKEESSRILGPGTYKEVVIRVYSRSLKNNKKNALYEASKKWFSKWNCKVERKQSGEKEWKEPRITQSPLDLLATTANGNADN